MATGPESQHSLHRTWRCGQGLCEATRSDRRKPHIASSSSLPARWYPQWPFPWQPCHQPHLPLRTSDVRDACRREGRCHPAPNKCDYQGLNLVLPDTTGSRPGALGHRPRRMQKTIRWNVAPLKCKTMPKCHNHCAPPGCPLFPSVWPGQGR